MSESVLTSTLQMLVSLYNEATATDIKMHVNRLEGDYVFTQKDHRTLNRIAYLKVPTIEAMELARDLKLFDSKMWRLLEEANLICDHENIRHDYPVGSGPNTVPTYICDDCETEMIEEEPGSYAVRTSL